MVNDLIKICQEDADINNCKDYGFLYCLNFLIDLYNEKYDKKYYIEELLDEC